MASGRSHPHKIAALEPKIVPHQVRNQSLGTIAGAKWQVVVCLGATAAQALLGKDFRVTQHRGEFVESTIAPYVTATVHPSSILRAPDEMPATKKWPASSPISKRLPAFCNEQLNYLLHA
jgi:hypothetical protein